MRKGCVALLVSLCPVLAGTVNAQGEEPLPMAEDMAQEYRQAVPLSQVPSVVMATARTAAPDVFFSEAQSYLADDVTVYRITGRLFREVWEVYVRQNGQFLRTTVDNQDD